MKTKVDKQGYVRHTSDPTREAWEHIRIAEEMLGRKLGKTEQVHHINGDKTDNRPENLMIMRSNGDHIRAHGVAKKSELIQTSDGSYVAIPCQRECVRCHRLFVPTNYDQIFCDLDCYHEHVTARIPTKSDLEQDLSSANSMCEIGRKYGVSDNAVRRWCDKYGLPKSISKK
jgi:hypothetical protein